MRQNREHLQENLLYAWVDHEVPAEQRALIQDHLQQCPDCRVRLDAIMKQTKRVNAHLDSLSPTFSQDPRAAYSRFTHSSRYQKTQKELIPTMFKQRSLWATLAIIAIVAVIVSATPARAWASSFLGLFRAQKVQVVTFDPAAVQNAHRQLEANGEAIQQLFQEDMQVTQDGESIKVASATEAQAIAGYTPRLPAAITDGTITVEPGMHATFTINQQKVQTLMEAAGIKANLPASVDGKTVTVDMSRMVTVSSGCTKMDEVNTDPTDPDQQSCTSVMQMPSPVVNAPDELNIQELGQAMFQFMGLSEEDAQALSQRIDWTSTLVLPIPNEGTIQYQDVQVDDVTGTLLQADKADGAMLIWVKNGVIYGVHSPDGAEKALEIAQSIK